MTHRQLVKSVQNKLEEIGITPYQLHQQLGGKVNKQSIYNFLNHGKFIRSDILLLILASVGMSVSDGSKVALKRKRS